MAKIRTVIIDDEPRARETIRNMLSLYNPNDIELVGEAAGVTTGIELINSVQPELVLLDIKMPDGTGFDLLKQLKATDFYLVFITAFDEYAIKAFKYSAVDYLLKPIDADELAGTIERIKGYRQNKNNDLSLVLKTLNELKKEPKSLLLKTIDSIHVVKVQDIIHCESSGNYTYFFIGDEKPILVSRTLKEYEDILCEHNFLRVHQSHLVNVDHIKCYMKNSGGMLVMKNNKSIPVAMRKKEVLLNALGLM